MRAGAAATPRTPGGAASARNAAPSARTTIPSTQEHDGSSSAADSTAATARGRPVSRPASAAAAEPARCRAESSAVAGGTASSSASKRSAVCTCGTGTRNTALTRAVPLLIARAPASVCSAVNCTSAGAATPGAGSVDGSDAR